MKGKAYVDAGICGFDATVLSEAGDPLGKATVSIETECPNLKKLGASFQVDIMDVVQKGCTSETFKKLVGVIPVMHCPCPVTYGVFQTIKIAAQLALPKDVSLSFLKE
ncbi:MAG: hypothetical protein AMS17_09295 [Spirochaetes bacterium DG_61]|jgi:hypothetical protein|nr:MAG: hypothetical protein AMS17_09295 [Spirochaetes bacterium DG_61]